MERRYKVMAYLVESANEKTGRGIGTLSVVAARAKVSEGDLRDIVFHGGEMTDEILDAVEKVISISN
jgi:hypothetical protein